MKLILEFVGTYLFICVSVVALLWRESRKPRKAAAPRVVQRLTDELRAEADEEMRERLRRFRYGNKDGVMVIDVDRGGR